MRVPGSSAKPMQKLITLSSHETETERFILTRSYGIPVELSTKELSELLGRSRQWVYETRRGTLKSLQRLGRALRGSVSQAYEAVHDPHRILKLRPVPVPEGISFLNGGVVKETDTPHPATEGAEQLYFAL